VTEPRLGLAANWRQFALLVFVNALVGGTIGLERSIIPSLARDEFGLDSYRAVLSFIVAFGVAKAFANYAAGLLADRMGRKPLLVIGWLLALPVPLLLMWAPTWAWVLAANVLLGVSQGLTWSMTVVMKVDIVGSERRGLAMGLNEFAGYLALAISAVLTATVAARYGLRPWPFAIGGALVGLGLVSSVLFVRETQRHAAAESRAVPGENVSNREAFARTTWRDRNLSAVTQAGFVNNLNDGMAWGLFPLLFAASGLGRRPARDGIRIGPLGKEVAHCRRHGPAGRGHRRDGGVPRHADARHRVRPARDRNGHGLPDVDGRDRGCDASLLACSRHRNLPAVARPRICGRSRGRGCPGRCDRPPWRGLGGGGGDARVGPRRRGPHARATAPAPFRGVPGARRAGNAIDDGQPGQRMTPIYLDYNASTPLLPEAFDAMLPFLRDGFGNASSAHPFGRAARDAVERARQQVAALLGCDGEEIVFT
jgi:nitrate/nitrite transporter NarK